MIGTAGTSQVLYNADFLAADGQAVLVEQHARPIELELHERRANRSPELTDLADAVLPAEVPPRCSWILLTALCRLPRSADVWMIGTQISRRALTLDTTRCSV